MIAFSRTWAMPNKETFTIEIIEIALVAHGGNHNDTIVTVEKKL